MALFGTKGTETGRNALVVTGAPGSGNATIIRACNLLGVPVGDNLSLPQSKSPYELQEVSALNEEVFRVFGLSSADTAVLPDNWLQHERVGALKGEIAKSLRSDFGAKNFWGVKDPRIARLVPLWLSVFEQIDYEPLFLIPVRNPLDVAGSLLEREGVELEKSLLLWLVYNLEVERFTRGRRRVFVYFSEFLKDWQKTLRRATKDLGIDLGIYAPAKTHEVETFLNGDLVSHKSQEEAVKRSAVIPPNVKEVFAALTAAAEGKEMNTRVLDTIMTEMRFYLGPVQDKIDSISQMKTLLAAKDAEIRKILSTIDNSSPAENDLALLSSKIKQRRSAAKPQHIAKAIAQMAEKKKTGALEYFLKGDVPLSEDLVMLADNIDRKEIAVLDVFPGPVSQTGSKMTGRDVKVVAVDPFADEYNRSLEEMKITPPVKLEKCQPERLLSKFAKESFDVVSCVEALEYCLNPVVAINQMCALLRPGGAVFLSHQSNKALDENYGGLRQWNCFNEEGEFVIWNNWYKFNVSRMLAGYYTVSVRGYVDFIETIISPLQS